MNNSQFATWQPHMGIAEGEVWDPFAAVKDFEDLMKAYLTKVPFFAKGARRFEDVKLAVPSVSVDTSREISTQVAFGKSLDDFQGRQPAC